MTDERPATDRLTTTVWDLLPNDGGEPVMLELASSVVADEFEERDPARYRRIVPGEPTPKRADGKAPVERTKPDKISLPPPRGRGSAYQVRDKVTGQISTRSAPEARRMLAADPERYSVLDAG